MVRSSADGGVIGSTTHNKEYINTNEKKTIIKRKNTILWTLTAWIFSRHRSSLGLHLNAYYCFHWHFCSWNRYGVWWQVDRLQHSERTFLVDIMTTAAMRCKATPLATIAWKVERNLKSISMTAWSYRSPTLFSKPPKIFVRTCHKQKLTSQALRRPTGFFAICTLGRLRQVSLPPMMDMLHRAQLLPRNVGRVLFTVGNCKVLAFDMRVILAY